MRVLVTGGAGFIGSHFVKRLVAGKEQVFKVNGKEQAESGNTKIFLVYPGDVITVSESWF